MKIDENRINTTKDLAKKFDSYPSLGTQVFNVNAKRLPTSFPFRFYISGIVFSQQE